jgi:hypothetical protein
MLLHPSTLHGLASMGAAQACVRGSRFAAFHLAHLSSTVLATLAAALMMLMATFGFAEAPRLSFLYYSYKPSGCLSERAASIQKFNASERDVADGLEDQDGMHRDWFTLRVIDMNR